MSPIHRSTLFSPVPITSRKFFYQSEEVRDLLGSSPDVCECWGLLCMRKEERRQFGMDLVGDEVRREVLQTGVSFTDHQIVSPGADEADARRAIEMLPQHDYLRKADLFLAV